MYSRKVEIKTSLNVQQTWEILSRNTEHCPSFTHQTTGKDEQKFFLGIVHQKNFHVKKNNFKSESERRRYYTLECKGELVQEGSGSRVTVEMKYFAIEKNMNMMGFGMLSFAALVLLFAYDGSNLLQIILAEAGMIFTLWGLFWLTNRNFNIMADQIEEKIRSQVSGDRVSS